MYNSWNIFICSWGLIKVGRLATSHMRITVNIPGHPKDRWCNLHSPLFQWARRYQSSFSPTQLPVPDGVGSCIAPFVITEDSDLPGVIQVSTVRFLSSSQYWLWRSSETTVFLIEAPHSFYICNTTAEVKPVLSVLNKKFVID